MKTVIFAFVIFIRISGSAQTASVDTSNQKSPLVASQIAFGSTFGLIGGGAAILAAQHGNGDVTVPVWMIVGGVLLGPLPGYIYAENVGRGMDGALIRLGVAVAGTLATFALVGSDWEGGGNNLTGAGIVLYGSAAFVAGFLIYDCVSAGNAIEARNNPSAHISFNLSPGYSVETRAPQLNLHLSF